ncbi:hypothetical protein ACHAWF_005152 [Thalassiosira exigua]
MLAFLFSKTKRDVSSDDERLEIGRKKSKQSLSSDEGRPEIAKAGERRRYELKPPAPEPVEICLESITSHNDLKSLKKRDSFSYYSIPAVRSAALLGEEEEVDPSDLGRCRLTRRDSCPALKTQGPGRSQRTVLRKKCISFEVYPDLLLEDLIFGDEEGEGCDVGSFGPDGALSGVETP